MMEKGGKVSDVSMEKVSRNGDTPDLRSVLTNTTCHGVKHIAEQDSHIFRKILWLICVTVALGLFLVNVISRAGNYFDYPTNVDVSVHYKESMQFPAVTLCNLNNYRITKAAEYNLFDFLENYYSSDKAQANEAVLQHMTILNETDTSVFIRDAAHQLEDSIYRCTWAEQPCDLKNDFETTSSDLGVCYTYMKENTVTAPGSRNALSLVLNLEQYEYMKGPHDDAGVKVLLHDPDEVALMGDLGFVLAPGTHTMVTIDQTQRSSLPAPYGLCHEDIRFRSNCLLECQIQKWIEEFKCVDVHMQNSCGNCTVCGMEELHTNRLKKLSGDCDCPVPCTRTMYDPRLSYAQISRNNIERLAKGSSQETSELKTKFHSAREVQERVVKVKADANEERIISLLKVVSEIQGAVKEGMSYLNSSSALANHIQIGNIFTEDANLFLSTLKAISQAYTSQRAILNIYKDILYLYEDRLALVRNLHSYYEYGISNITASGIKPEDAIDFIRNCTYTMEDLTSAKHHSMGRSDLALNATPCNAYLTSIVVGSSSIMTQLTMFRFLWNIPERNKNLTKALYGEWEQIPESELCHVAVNEIMQECFTPITEAKSAFFALNAGQSLELNVMKITSAINQTHDFTLRLLNGSFPDVIDNCAWVFAEWPVELKAIRTFRENPNPTENEKWLLYESSLNTATGAFDSFQVTFQELRTQLTALDSTLKSFNDKIQLMKYYLLGHITKTEATSVMVSSAIKKMYMKLQQTIESVLSGLDQFIQNDAYISQSTQIAFKQILSLTIPILRSEVLVDLPLWQRLVVQSTNPAIVDIVKKDDFDLRQQAGEVMGRGIELYARDARNLSQTLNVLEKEFTRSYDILEKDSDLFLQENALDHAFYFDNLLKVDIYYEEMSMTGIEQKPAFKLLSLFGEVGGFLGLLLGASVLTICEVIDFGVMIILAKMRAKR